MARVAEHSKQANRAAEEVSGRMERETVDVESLQNRTDMLKKELIAGKRDLQQVRKLQEDLDTAYRQADKKNSKSIRQLQDMGKAMAKAINTYVETELEREEDQDPRKARLDYMNLGVMKAYRTFFLKAVAVDTEEAKRTLN